MRKKTLTNDEFLNMIDGILPKNDRSNLIECYPEEEQEKTEEKIEQRKEKKDENKRTNKRTK